MTVECAFWESRLERAAKEAENQLDSIGYMVAWRLKNLAGELMARNRSGQTPTEAIAQRRDHAKAQSERGDPEAKLEYELLARLLAEGGTRARSIRRETKALPVTEVHQSS